MRFCNTALNALSGWCLAVSWQTPFSFSFLMQNYLYGSVISIKCENCPFQAGRRKRVNHEQEMIQLNTIDTSSSNARCVDATPLLFNRGRRAVERKPQSRRAQLTRQGTLLILSLACGLKDDYHQPVA